ncbi:hypothetical protein ACOMHN_020368 [Nucella lapillus]
MPGDTADETTPPPPLPGGKQWGLIYRPLHRQPRHIKGCRKSNTSTASHHQTGLQTRREEDTHGEEKEGGGGDEETPPPPPSPSTTTPCGARLHLPPPVCCSQECGDGPFRIPQPPPPPPLPTRAVNRVNTCLNTYLRHARAWLPWRHGQLHQSPFTSLPNVDADSSEIFADKTSPSAISPDSTSSLVVSVNDKQTSAVFVNGTSSSTVSVNDTSSSAVSVTDTSCSALLGDCAEAGCGKECECFVNDVGDVLNADTDRLVTEQGEEEGGEGGRGGRMGCPLREQCRHRMNNITVVSLVWTLLSLAVAGACAVSFYHANWVSHPDRLHSFGLFRRCVPDPHPPPPPPSPGVRCEGYGPGGRIEVGGIPGGAWRASSVLFGGGAILQGVGAVVTVMLLLMPPPSHHHHCLHHHHHHHHHQHYCGAGRLAMFCGYLQTLAGLLMARPASAACTAYSPQVKGP